MGRCGLVNLGGENMGFDFFCENCNLAVRFYLRNVLNLFGATYKPQRSCAFVF